ncbi:MAG: hypothetical protein ACYS4W_08495 [Planctomycetota bacterium]|jgi:hypothetical protein
MIYRLRNFYTILNRIATAKYFLPKKRFFLWSAFVRSLRKIGINVLIGGHRGLYSLKKQARSQQEAGRISQKVVSSEQKSTPFDSISTKITPPTARVSNAARRTEKTLGETRYALEEIETHKNGWQLAVDSWWSIVGS